MKVLDRANWTFSKNHPPQATALPGEVLMFKTQDCFAGQITSEQDLVKTLNLDHTNPTAGPVYIEGAQPGDVLAVDILDIAVDKTGFSCTFEKEGCLSHLAETRTRMFRVNDGYTSFHDVTWKIEPMIGVIGTAPAEGEISCGYSGTYGGNMDSRYIRKGSRVYLPVNVPGALLQMGDLHASMGDGESCGTGIEIGGEIIVKTELIKNFRLDWPVTETEDWWYVNSTGDSYGDSLMKGSAELARLMKPVYGWDETDIFIYLSVRGSVEINQAVYPDPHPMLTLRVGIPKVPGKKLI